MKSLRSKIQDLLCERRLEAFGYDEAKFYDLIDVVYDYDADSELWKECEAILGERLFHLFTMFVAGYYKLVPKKKIYDICYKMPADRLERVLGGGADGFAISIGNKIVKVFNPNSNKYSISKTRSDRSEKFYRACKENVFQCFPRVYRLTDKIVTMDQVDPNTPWCHRWSKYFDRDNKKSLLYKFLHGSKPLFLRGEEKECWEWMEQCKQECNVIGIDFGDDLREGNYGETGDGRLVQFDV